MFGIMHFQRLSIYLLKDNTTPQQAISSHIDEFIKQELNPDDNLPDNSFFYLKKIKTGDAPWKSYINLPNAPAEFLESKTPSGLACIPYIDANNATHWFLINFGHGYVYINREMCVKDFGSITALNLLDKNKISSVDTFSLTTPKRERIQSTQLNTFEFFDVNAEESIVKNIAGSLKEQSTNISRVVGDCCINVSTNYPLSQIEVLLEHLYKSYLKKDDYTKVFPELQYTKKIDDDFILQKLDSKLLNAIKNNSDEIQIAVPFITDSYENNEFIFNHISNNVDKDGNTTLIKIFSEPLPFINTENLYTFITDKNIPVDSDFFYFTNVIVTNKDKINSQSEYNIKEVINFSTTYQLNNQIKECFFYNNDWYFIDKDFIDRLNNFLVDYIEVSFPFLPSYTYTYMNGNEDKYNKYCASKNKNTIALLDKNDFYIQGYAIEPSDLLYYSPLQNKDKIYLIHNKIYSASHVLSHLFNQGYVSLKLLINDANKRKELENKVINANPSLKIPSDLFNNTKNYQIVFGILSDKYDDSETDKSKLVQRLPLFSKITLQQTIRNFLKYNVSVKVCFIKMNADKNESELHSHFPSQNIQKNDIFQLPDTTITIKQRIFYLDKTFNDSIYKALISKTSISPNTFKILKSKKDFAIIEILKCDKKKENDIQKSDILVDSQIQNSDSYFDLWKNGFFLKENKISNTDEYYFITFKIIYPNY